MLKKINYTKTLFYLLLLTAIGFGIYFYSSVFGHLIAGFVLAYILDPLVNAVERLRLPRWLAVLSVYIIIIGAIALLVVLFAPSLYEQVAQVVSVLQENGSDATNPLVELPLLKDIHLFLIELDARVCPGPGKRVCETHGYLGGELGCASQDHHEKLQRHHWSCILCGHDSADLLLPLAGQGPFSQGSFSLIPNRYFEPIVILSDKIDETVGKYMRAMLFEVLAVALMTFIALRILGVPYAILIGVIAGFANIIPYFGPFIGGCVAVLSSLIAGQPPIMIFWVILAMILVQQVDNNLVYPVLVGKTIDMHPLVVFFTVLAGGWFGSLIWMLISVPLLYITYTMIKETYLNFKMFKLL